MRSAFGLGSFLLLFLIGQNTAYRVALPAWKYDESTNSESKKVVYEEIGRCRDPASQWKWSGQDDAPWETDFSEAVKMARAHQNSPHAQTTQRPLKHLFGYLSKYLPHHQAVQLTTDRMKEVPEGQFSPDSQCFAFDYGKFSPGDADPHGCGFFKKSFQPLQKLRQCIIDKLESSGHWKAYEAVAKTIRAAKRAGSREKVDRYIRDDNGTAIAKATKGWGTAYDSIRRADEMIKSVSFKDWQGLNMTAIKKEVIRKIETSVTTKKRQSVLEEETVAAIRRDCFLVDDDVTADGVIPYELATLKNAMPCYHLMWDQVEVPGAPTQPFVNAISMWEPLLLGASTTVRHEHHVPPICARAAVALIAGKQKRAPGKYKGLSCTRKGTSWKTCMHPKHFNCICFTSCFKNALDRLCEIDDGCCDSRVA